MCLMMLKCNSMFLVILQELLDWCEHYENCTQLIKLTFCHMIQLNTIKLQFLVMFNILNYSVICVKDIQMNWCSSVSTQWMQIWQRVKKRKLYFTHNTDSYVSGWWQKLIPQSNLNWSLISFVCFWPLSLLHNYLKIQLIMYMNIVSTVMMLGHNVAK
jgi:hypothetical protein